MVGSGVAGFLFFLQLVLWATRLLFLSFVRLEQRSEEKERNIPGLTLLQIKDPLCGSVSLKAPKRPHKRISYKLVQVLRVRGQPKTDVEVSFSFLLVLLLFIWPWFSQLLHAPVLHLLNFCLLFLLFPLKYVSQQTFCLWLSPLVFLYSGRCLSCTPRASVLTSTWMTSKSAFLALFILWALVLCFGLICWESWPQSSTVPHVSK